MDRHHQHRRGVAEPSTGAPDLTDAIMHRLGYRRVSSAARRRRRVSRIGRRVALFVTVLAVVGVSIGVYSTSARARRPVGPTIPSALINDVERQRQSFDSTIQTIRRRLHRPVEAPAAEVEPGEPDREPRTRTRDARPSRKVRWI